MKKLWNTSLSTELLKMTIKILDIEFSDNGQGVCRVSVDEGIYDPEFMGWNVKMISQFPVLLPGKWNQSQISKDRTGNILFSHIEETSKAVTDVWHSLHFIILEFKTKKIRGGVHRVSNFDVYTIVKYAIFDHFLEAIDKETSAYRWLQGTGIGPRLLGHVAENGFVRGFLLEDITETRPAGPEDLSACQAALRELHELDIRHGDINRFNFLVKKDNVNLVTIVDFAEATQGATSEELMEEMHQLEEALRDLSGRVGTSRVLPDDSSHVIL